MNQTQVFIAKLVGSEEVPPVRTNATGVTKFTVSNDGRKIVYELTVNHLDNFTQAHIHLGRRGMNGPVVAFLFGPANPDISVTRGFVEGIITEKDLVGPLQGKPLSVLIDLMRDEKTYVNAHTAQNPDGEIRGQIMRPGTSNRPDENRPRLFY
ncbi:CHRD domain-containing protein [Niallia endozanthoxylica]|uniref:CHRD domain-containing protein n=1 Tax=Niallia endozanthoxylica TaxID=2036016 RepID=A0A5J5HZ79_9BACI|nr:CHRD domain-containing protein [Niallia endozanthoxylica]KAA9028472.1 CHRD domain-containing protein [Niallia endozanthoxylica]